MALHPLYFCRQCLSHFVPEPEHTRCVFCDTLQDHGSASFAPRVNASSRGGALLAALGVSLSLAACETPQKPDAPVATSPEVSQDQGASQPPIMLDESKDMSEESSDAGVDKSLKSNTTIPSMVEPPVQMYGAVPVEFPETSTLPASADVPE